MHHKTKVYELGFITVLKKSTSTLRLVLRKLWSDLEATSCLSQFSIKCVILMCEQLITTHTTSNSSPSVHPTFSKTGSKRLILHRVPTKDVDLFKYLFQKTHPEITTPRICQPQTNIHAREDEQHFVVYKLAQSACWICINKSGRQFMTLANMRGEESSSRNVPG